MAILRPQLDPSAGIPTPVILKPRQKMNQANFYQQMNQPAQPQFMLGDTTPKQPQYAPQQQEQPAAEQITSQNSIVSQFQRLAQRPAVPELQPGARVQSPNAELVQPSNFDTFYKRLSAIRDSNEALLGAAQARSSYQRQQAQQAQMSAFQNQILGTGKSGSSSGGQAFGSGVPSNPAANFKFAQNIAGNYGWGANELSAWYTLGMKESGWRNNAQNPTSTAYGIGQFLDSTWKGYGISKTSDPGQQVEAMARYIKARYGSPSKALAFHLSHNWY